MNPQMNPQNPLRLALWSGPRNISTAMMRSWGNRPDTFVCDEPLYAHYLNATGRDHPGAREVIAAGETDWRRAAAWLTGPVPEGKTIFYQKHMTHHLLPDMGRDWLGALTHGFLIRDPRAVIVSYIKKNRDPTVEDLGFVQQAAIFDWVRERTGVVPPVLEAHDVLDAPEAMLRRLCAAVGVGFLPAMLSWPPGLRPTDGVWAAHWYPEVETSTSFRPARTEADPVPARLRGVYEQCLEPYQRLYAHRIQAQGPGQHDRTF
jgi:hypothetical protein